MNKIIVCLSIFLVISCTERKSSDNGATPVGRTITPERELVFLSADGTPITTIQVAVADDDNERNMGLMDVRTMPADQGMVFIFEEESPQSFWMANTPLSLDIIYVAADSSIVRIYQSTIPFSEATLPSDYPAQFVVETNAGFTLANGITEGMRIRF